MKKLLDSIKENRSFALFIFAVLLTFVYMRPLNSPWHPFIAGDGLGYYSYLPAKYIHGDPNFDFKWFNRVYNENYIYSAFTNPEDNLLVEYHGKKINKYYPGLAYIWLPFFFVGHIIAKIFHYQADGFSLPYQLSIGLASVFYLLMGFWYLRKLLSTMFEASNKLDITLFAIFFGTNLFNYSLFANSLSHVYSFSMMMPMFYYGYEFFNSKDKRLNNVLLFFLFLVITVSIRPLNILAVLLLIPYFQLKIITSLFKKVTLHKNHLIVLMMIVSVLVFHFSIVYKQTGSFFAYTYTGESFDFGNSKFFDALISYHNGLWVYSPLILLSLIGVSALRKKLELFLPFVFFLIVFIYASWWFWPITKRALIDFYIVPALLIAAYLKKNEFQKTKHFIFIGLLIMCVGYYQLKAYQLRKGILDENNTHQQLFWDNFFRVEKTSRYPIPLESISRKMEIVESFDMLETTNGISINKSYSGKKSLLLDSIQYIHQVAKFPFPLFYSSEHFNKVRVSFNCFFEHGIEKMHAILQFKGYKDEVLVEQALYLSKEDIHAGKWDYKEFGYEFEGLTVLNNKTVKQIELTFWNVENKSKVYIDDVKTEFIVTKESFETIK